MLVFANSSLKAASASRESHTLVDALPLSRLAQIQQRLKGGRVGDVGA